jgi:hypothetical protein
MYANSVVIVSSSRAKRSQAFEQRSFADVVTVDPWCPAAGVELLLCCGESKPRLQCLRLAGEKVEVADVEQADDLRRFGRRGGCRDEVDRHP